MRALALNPDLLICWSKGRLLIHDLVSGRQVQAVPRVVTALDLFRRPRTAAAAVKALPQFERASVLRGIRALAQVGLLLPVAKARECASRIASFRGNLASAYYHSACRDPTYLQDPAEIELFLRARVLTERRPKHFKRYPTAPRLCLPRSPDNAAGSGTIEDVLQRRRTVRRFVARPVELDDFAAVVRGTWGRTGWLDGGILGRLAAKSSPSAGALHPIECYILAWNVRGLPPGLYHYDVAGDELRRLRSGVLRAEALQAASGQRWVGQAAFLCMMTAVFRRTLWKYQLETAYRGLWLEAGHLAQTFCLLATSRGLGPFTTVALQDSHIERLIGIDGTREFPVYLCGAGVPSGWPSLAAAPRARGSAPNPSRAAPRRRASSQPARPSAER